MKTKNNNNYYYLATIYEYGLLPLFHEAYSDRSVRGFFSQKFYYAYICINNDKTNKKHSLRASYDLCHKKKT